MSTRYIQVIAGPLSTSNTRQLFGVDKGNVGISADAANSYRIGYNQNGTIVYLADDGGSGPARLPIFNPKAYAMGNAAGGGAQGAVGLFTVTTTALTGDASGTIFYSLHITDGTDVQDIASIVTYSVVDKAGTQTATITEVSANQAKAVSAGTVTIAWTITSSTHVATIKANVTTSLTPTTDALTYSVFPTLGTVVTL